MRLLLFTGKGGVGKTTIASATALHAAERGLRTLLVSTDLAHNLADLLGSNGGPAGWQAAERLWVREIDVFEELGRVWGELKDYLGELLRYFGFRTLMEEEALLLPGVSEFFILSSVLDAAVTGDYDLIVLDCGPTADTMRLLNFADSAPERMHKFLSVQRTVVGMMRPWQRLIEAPLPREEALERLGPLADRADQIRRTLLDPHQTSVRLVLNPEPLALAETRRLYTYCRLFGLTVDAVVINKLLPPACRGGFLAQRYEGQAPILESIEASFAGLPRLAAEFAPAELAGPEALLRLGQAIYSGLDPAGPVAAPERFDFERTADGRRVLRIGLPIAAREDVTIKQQGPHLMIKVQSFVRLITLPDSLTHAPLLSARAASGMLVLTFDEKR